MNYYCLSLIIILFAFLYYVTTIENFSTSHGTMLQMTAKGYQDNNLTYAWDRVYRTKGKIPKGYYGWYPSTQDTRRKNGLLH